MRKGFTLIEMLVVIALAASAVGASPYVPSPDVQGGVVDSDEVVAEAAASGGEGGGRTMIAPSSTTQGDGGGATPSPSRTGVVESRPLQSQATATATATSGCVTVNPVTHTREVVRGVRTCTVRAPRSVGRSVAASQQPPTDTTSGREPQVVVINTTTMPVAASMPPPAEKHPAERPEEGGGRMSTLEAILCTLLGALFLAGLGWLVWRAFSRAVPRNPNAPDGQQVAYLLADGSISSGQLVAGADGSVTLRVRRARPAEGRAPEPDIEAEAPAN